jgi:hypothetical protein
VALPKLVILTAVKRARVLFSVRAGVPRPAIVASGVGVGRKDLVLFLQCPDTLTIHLASRRVAPGNSRAADQHLCNNFALVSWSALLWTKKSISKGLAAPRVKETKYR